MTVATVRILSLPYHVNNRYDYTDPQKEAFIGAFVGVPFGQGNRISLGVVTEVREEEPSPMVRYKPVDTVYRREFSLNGEFLKLAYFLEQTTMCSFGDAVKTVYPVSVLGRLNECYERTEKAPTGLNSRAFSAYEFVVNHPGMSRIALVRELGDGTAEALRYLCKNGYLRSYAMAEDDTNIAFDEYYSVTGAPLKTKSPKLLAAFEYLNCRGETERSLLMKATGVNSAHLKSAAEQGAIACRKVQRYRGQFLSRGENASPTVLTDEQTAAKEKILELYGTGQAKAALLYGVTGSGKTSVLKALCDEVINSGRQVIMLVPEISLTPQSVSVFSAYYKDRVAVLHSGLSEGERHDAWRRIRSGGADLVIGTRSAAFAPVPSLGMFIIDEEQEHTYKSESNPKYHARDIARFRCAENDALMVLSSATPSVESFYKAEKGMYTLVRLDNRYGEAQLPKVKIADMRVDISEGRTSPLGTELISRLRENLQAKKQSILFLNRRGFSHFLVCKLCGKAVVCPKCDVSLTYHKEKDKGGFLMCHYCGYRRTAVTSCPECGSAHIEPVGYGIQMIEQELSEALPDARILRMDADTTRTKASHGKILEAFRNHEADILLGTQMVTKGHDFPGVTLVGVISADGALYLDDYNAEEKTFSLLTQVVGRSGRGKEPGTALIQTFNPEHEIIELAKRQDYDSFYSSEIKLRRALGFPPFCDIVRVLVSSDDEGVCFKVSEEFARLLRQYDKGEYGDIPLSVFGPMEARIKRINNITRYQTVCKCRLTKKSRRLISDIYKSLSAKYLHRAQISVDLNPSQL